ncbi:MAG: beta-glucosidase [Lentisphaerae bacterium]|nr:beta-glucosidase [Lentisphaerota bacterium]
MQSKSPRFLWGTATAAFQIEGAPAADGKRESNWDRFSHTPGKITDGHTADVTCDHYHRWHEDLKLMEWLGVNAYRFSICWSRVLPRGKGRVNQAGLDFYQHLIDGLLDRGITPLVTIWHGDHPQELESAGGWLNRDMIAHYADYAGVLFERLGDRVRHWITLNEPNCFLYQGYGDGLCPPGHTDWKLAYQAVHHALVGHGEAVRRFRDMRMPGDIGITMSCMQWSPATDSAKDQRAAELADHQNNLWLLDPLHGRGYPELYRTFLGELAPAVRDGDQDVIASPTDFLGVNYYQNMHVAAGTLQPDRAGPIQAYTTVHKENSPAAFLAGLKRLNQRYGPRTFIVTENGLYKKDETLAEDGTCDDHDRVDYLRTHVAALQDAIASGVDIRGYCIWSLMDNFEWSAGFTARYGLFFTDYPTQKRVAKSSARWYRDFLKEGRL